MQAHREDPGGIAYGRTTNTFLGGCMIKKGSNGFVLANLGPFQYIRAGKGDVLGMARIAQNEDEYKVCVHALGFRGRYICLLTARKEVLKDER
jgi:hypothetical protein